MSPLELSCPKCKTTYHSDREHIGRRIKCVKCGNEIPIEDGGQIAPINSAPPRVVIEHIIDVQKKKKRLTSTFLIAAVLAIIVVGSFVFANRKTEEQEKQELQRRVAAYAAPPQNESAEPSGTPPSTAAQPRDLGKDTDFQPTVENQSKSGSSILVPLDEVEPIGTTKTKAAVRPKRDIGIDQVSAKILPLDVMAGPNPDGLVLETVKNPNELLVLLDPEPKNNYFNIVVLSTGRAGWVDREKVDVLHTRHPSKPAEFQAQYTGQEADPKIVIYNQSNQTIRLRFAGSDYSLVPNAQQTITHPAGSFSYYAWAPLVIPTGGSHSFERGYRYDWTFWIASR